MKLSFLFILCALPVTAADVTGNWLASITGPDGNVRKTYYDLKQDGSQVSGFMRTASFDRPVEGTIDDAGNLTLTSPAPAGSGRPAMKTQGVLKDDGLHLTMRMRPNMPALEVVAAKVAAGEGGAPAYIAPPAIHDVRPNRLAKTPPMGWNSWNKFAGRVTAEDVKGMADAIVTSGMKDAGYVYVNIDDTWEAGRDAQGNIQTNKKFPDMKALADYVHSKGLKIGIYSSPGPATCAGYEGSYGHEAQDAKTYAAWGIDYLKYDWCGAARVYKDSEMRAVYQKMGDALLATGRPIVYSLCQYGRADVQEWGPSVGGNLWRTTGDIRDSYDSMEKIGFDQNRLAPFAAPGHWNDPDMLEVGNGGMTADEYRTHMSLWSLLSAPLLAGNDIRSARPETLAILMNREVIAIDQDALGKQATRLSQEGEREVWVKELKDGSKAYGLFNRGGAAAQMKLPVSGKVRDLWEKKDVKGSEFTVPSHGVVLLKVS